MPDGRTIEQHFQCDVKQYDVGGTNWRLGKGKPPRDTSVDMWGEYKQLWSVWVDNNLTLFRELAEAAKAKDGILSDCFASTPISQARALCELLNERL